MFLLSTPPPLGTPLSDYPSPTPISSPPRKLDTLDMTSSSTLTKPQLQIVIFVVLIFAFLLSCVAVAACFSYRKRLAARRASRAPSTSNRIPASSSQVLSAPASVVDLEKGVPAPSSKPMAHNEDHPQRMSLFSSFFRWRHRVLYESHPVPELALLPSYKPEESVFRKSLNTVLLKKEVKPDPPTIASVKQAIEAAERRSGVHNTVSETPRKSKERKTASFNELPTIIIHCSCNAPLGPPGDDGTHPPCASCPTPVPFCCPSPPAPLAKARFPVTAAASQRHDAANVVPTPKSGVASVRPCASATLTPLAVAPASLRIPSESDSVWDEKKHRLVARTFAPPSTSFVLTMPTCPRFARARSTSEGSEASSTAEAPFPLSGKGPEPGKADAPPAPCAIVRLTTAGSTASSLVDLLLEAIAADSDDESWESACSASDSRPSTPTAHSEELKEEDISTSDVLKSWLKTERLLSHPPESARS